MLLKPMFQILSLSNIINKFLSYEHLLILHGVHLQNHERHNHFYRGRQRAKEGKQPREDAEIPLQPAQWTHT